MISVNSVSDCNLIKITSYLEIKDSAACEKVCGRWKRIISSHNVCIPKNNLDQTMDKVSSITKEITEFNKELKRSPKWPLKSFPYCYDLNAAYLWFMLSEDTQYVNACCNYLKSSSDKTTMLKFAKLILFFNIAFSNYEKGLFPLDYPEDIARTTLAKYSNIFPIHLVLDEYEKDGNSSKIIEIQKLIEESQIRKKMIMECDSSDMRYAKLFINYFDNKIMSNASKVCKAWYAAASLKKTPSA